ncbi:MAG: hypothetical protein JSU98_13130 [Gemmatimonadales bacterium]|jgi:sulfocyanin|nr:MAG: hypothetical protein JSU98_13130 [Gemmatimonadales bacterium]
MKRFAFSTALFFGLVACGGGEPAAEAAAEGAAEAAPAAEAAAPAQAGEMTMPAWYQMDGTNVTLDIIAGQTNKGNYWNFNGAQFGETTIVVPVGAEVTINFSNNDPNMAHSVGISAGFDTAPAMVDVTPIFEGAISSNPTSMTDATLPGQSETITFTASEAGEYTMVCYIPGHAVSGMWIRFNVSADGEAGVMGAM